MHYYDSTLASEGFVPGTFEPKPWGWYGVPGKPNEVLQKVEIPDLSESLDEMDYVASMVEKATGAVSTKQGVQTQREATLGEIRALQAEATERTQGMSKFYTKAWEQRAYKFYKLIEAAQDKLDAVKIYKKGRNTDNIYGREISPKDWMTKSGYKVRVWSQDEKKTKDLDSIQKLQVLAGVLPMNPKVKDIQVRKLAEFADLTPDEVTEIMDYEEQQRQSQMMMGGMMGQPPVPQQPVQPTQQPTYS